MITLEISNKNIEVDYADNLECKFAVFIIEFDYDNRLYVGHTIMRSVKTEIRKFINSVLDDSIKQNVHLKESMQNSKTLYISVIKPQEYTLDCLFKTKYSLIVTNSCYEPLGFNKICLIGNKYEEEKKYIRFALEKIGSTYKKVALASNARSVKEYEYAKNKGYIEIAEWPSITAAARHYGINASNIAACCSGRLHTSYGRLWRYSD